jgi:hypothetical protein
MTMIELNDKQKELLEKIREGLKREYNAELPEDPTEFINGLRDAWAALPASEQEKASLAWRSKEARENDTPDGYAHFFWCCTRRELPKHALYGWIVPLYLSHRAITLEEFKAFYDRPDAKRYRFIRDYVLAQLDEISLAIVIGVVIEASRELTKTTAITNYFTAFRIGQQPHRANLLIQVGDDIAKDNSSQIARVIKEYEGWKACFPHVVPDEVKGWGDKGYEVRQTHTWENGKMVPLGDAEWNKLIATRKDPTLLGVGYSSHALIGKHPDGILVVDDIHDEKNTSSDKELDGVLDIVESVIGYTFTSDAWVGYVGTPWVEGDTLDYIKSTHVYLSIVMPAYVEVVDGKVRLPEEWKEDTQKIFMWPEMRGLEWVMKKLSQTRKMSEFLRMILLALKSAGEKIYKYKQFPHKEIRWDDWEIVNGVDPTATHSTVNGEGGVSHFGICHALVTHFNTIVIGGGYLEKVTSDVGERELVKFQRMHSNCSRSSVEQNGAGAIFIGMAVRNAGLVINPHNATELGSGPKKQRQFSFLSPLLASGVVQISDEDTPYLNALRKYFQRYPNISDDSELLDAADALCMAVLDIPEVWANTVVNVVDPKKLERRGLNGKVIPALGSYRYLGR